MAMNAIRYAHQKRLQCRMQLLRLLFFVVTFGDSSRASP